MIFRSRRNAGFTLSELMTSLAVVGILAAMAVPSFRGLIVNNRATTETNEFLGQLNYARSEAIKQGTAVTICSSTDGKSCSGSTQWENGWIIFTDSLGNPGVRDFVDDGVEDENDELLLRVMDSFTSNVTLSADKSYVRYLATGVVGS